MDINQFFINISEFAKKHSEFDDIHGFPHIRRVFNLCLRIGAKLNANLKVLKTAALLHDIGRKISKSKKINKNHAEISANLAYKYLSLKEFDFSPEELDNIIHCIKSHSFSNEIKPRSLEAKILSDADKLDAIGAIGLYRTIGFTIKNEGTLNDVIKHIEEKIIKLKDMLILDISREIGEKRHQIVIDFYEQIISEADLD